VIWRIGRRAGGNGGVDGHNTAPNPWEGDFLLVPLLIFITLPSLWGDGLFGRPFFSQQVALSSPTSPRSDTAAPNINVPLPSALRGASPSLHAQHKEQCFLFLLESFEWLHRWQSHDEARRVADTVAAFYWGRVRGRLEKSWQVWPGNLDEKILQFLFVEFILIYIHNLQYCVKFLNWGGYCRPKDSEWSWGIVLCVLLVNC